jgi:transcriptional regulator GlxA family with amidase domain
MLPARKLIPTRATAAATEPPEAIGFLLLPGFTLITFSSAIEPLRLANYIAGRELYRWALLSADGAPVRSSGGIPVAVDHAIDDAPRLTTLIVCGGLGSEVYEDRHVFAWLRRAAASGATVGSLCIASHVLARAGLLEGYRCTIHWENLAGFAETFPDVNATGELFTIDRKRFTCAGGTVALDLVLHLIAHAHGEALAIGIAEQLLHDKIRAGSARQHLAIRPDPRIDRDEVATAIALMREHLEQPLEIAAIAARVGYSRRNLERLFRQSVECAPARYYMQLRLQRARQLLAQTRMSVTGVSVACGFQSAAHFSKAYRASFGAAPRDDQAARQRRRPPLGDAAATA